MLNCFYDLSIAPCSYDFFAFLISAELHRKRNGFESLAVIFLPGPNNGYRHDNLRTFDQNDNFFKNVLLNGPLLYKSCKSIVWLNDRSEAKKYLEPFTHVFPRGFTLQNPVTDYVYHGIVTSYFRGDDPVFFEAPPYAKSLAKSALSKISVNKSFITLTTRELQRDDPGTRRIDFEVWKNFFSQLDRSRFQPLIIRDTSMAFNSAPLFDDVPEIEAASIHLHMRYAIYQESFLNIFKPNGPSIISSYGTAPNLFFFEHNDQHCAISKSWYKTHYGMNRDSQFPLTTQNKRIVWDKESLELLNGTIKFLNESDVKLQSLLYPITDKITLMDTTKIALMHTIDNLKFGVLGEDVRVFQFYKDLLDRRLVSGPEPKNLILDYQKKGNLPKNTWDEILEIDRSTKSVLDDKSLVYQTG